MNCPDAQLAISLQLDDELSIDAEADLMEHLARCAACREQSLKMSALQGQLHAALASPVGSDYAPAWRRPARRRPALLAAAALLVVTLVGATMILPHRPTFAATLELRDQAYRVRLYGEGARLLTLEISDGPESAASVDYTTAEETP